MKTKRVEAARRLTGWVIVGALLLSSPAASASEKTDKGSMASVSSSNTSKYVGSETCKTCHEELYNSWQKTPHFKTMLNTKAGPAHQGCEGCHGPGAEHVAGGGDKTQDLSFCECLPQGDDHTLPYLPCRGTSEFRTFCPWPCGGELHRLPQRITPRAKPVCSKCRKLSSATPATPR